MGVSVQIGFICDGPDEGERAEDCELSIEPILSDTISYAWRSTGTSVGWHKRSVKSGGRHTSGSRYYCPACWELSRKRRTTKGR